LHQTQKEKSRHDQYAPYWAVALGVFGVTGLSTNWVDLGTFWSGYVLDILGPAWNYILFRGLFTAKTDNLWTTWFTPVRTLVLLLGICFGIEALQFFEVYDATYDPWDLLAYSSLIMPLFFLDLRGSAKTDKTRLNKPKVIKR
jgi:hypothetical protein